MPMFSGFQFPSAGARTLRDAVSHDIRFFKTNGVVDLVGSTTLGSFI
jgi:hypothetical protein